MPLPPAKPPRAPAGTMGHAVYTERLRRGLTQVQLGKAAKIGQSQVSVIESTPSAKVRAKTVPGVAAAFECDPFALFDGKIIPAQEPGRIMLGKAARRLELSLSAANLQRWIDFGEGLLQAQPNHEPEVVAAVRRNSRLKT